MTKNLMILLKIILHYMTEITEKMRSNLRNKLLYVLILSCKKKLTPSNFLPQKLFNLYYTYQINGNYTIELQHFKKQ